MAGLLIIYGSACKLTRDQKMQREIVLGGEIKLCTPALLYRLLGFRTLLRQVVTTTGLPERYA